MEFQSAAAGTSSTENQNRIADDEPEVRSRSAGAARCTERELHDNQCEQHQQFAQREAAAVSAASFAQQQEETECRLSVSRRYNARDTKRNFLPEISRNR